MTDELFPAEKPNGEYLQHWVRNGDVWRVWTMSAYGIGWTDHKGELVPPVDGWRRGWRYVCPAVPPTDAHVAKVNKRGKAKRAEVVE